MASRTFDIILSCGCAISLDAGGGLMPCSYDDNPDCKYKEEYLDNELFPMWEQECWRRNGHSEDEVKKEFGDRYVELINESDDGDANE